MARNYKRDSHGKFSRSGVKGTGIKGVAKTLKKRHAARRTKVNKAAGVHGKPVSVSRTAAQHALAGASVAGRPGAAIGGAIGASRAIAHNRRTGKGLGSKRKKRSY